MEQVHQQNLKNYKIKDSINLIFVETYQFHKFPKHDFYYHIQLEMNQIHLPHDNFHYIKRNLYNRKN